MKSARNLLPRPATGSSSAICSGVSILNCSKGSTVISTRWLRQREVYWKTLEELVERVTAHGFGALSRQELQEIGRLYRQMAADLATLREDPGSARVAASVNQLLARAHHTIYSAERPTRSATLRYFRETFPAAFRRHRLHCMLALAL